MEITYPYIDNIPMKLYKTDHAVGTIVAVHGFGGSKESNAISLLAEQADKKALNVLTFDLPAHGERNETADQLSVSQCIWELITAEKYAKELGSELYAFATSFGGMCMLHRLEERSDEFKKIVLRVPAVNMSESMVDISRLTDSKFSMEAAKECGFKIKLGREYDIPYRFYEELLDLHCMRYSEAWNSSRILTIYAENDELVKASATEKFLSCNPLISSHCIKACGHRMAQPYQLAEAIDKAMDFLLSE